MKVELLFGGTRAQFGWLFASFGLAFCIMAARAPDVPFVTYDGVAHGHVIAVSETNQEVGEARTYAVDARFTDDHGRDRVARSYTEAPPSLDADVTIEYNQKHAQIEGMRNGETPFWVVLLFLLFPAVGLWLALGRVRRSLRAIHLLRHGQVVQATLVDKTTVGVELNEVPETRLTFEFALPNGRVQHCEVRTHDPERLEDPTETLVYDPSWPDHATPLDHLPGSPRIDADGRLSATPHARVLILPALVAALAITLAVLA